MWWEERYWLLLDGEWEEGNRAPLVTVAQWVVSSSPALLSAVTGLRGRGTGLPLSLSTPLSSRPLLSSRVQHLSRCPVGPWSPPHCLSHSLTPTLWALTGVPELHCGPRDDSFPSLSVTRCALLCLLFASFHLALIPQHDGSRSSCSPLMSRTSFITVFLLLLCS